jgi:hypothetical protein
MLFDLLDGRKIVVCAASWVIPCRLPSASPMRRGAQVGGSGPTAAHHLGCVIRWSCQRGQHLGVA